MEMEDYDSEVYSQLDGDIPPGGYIDESLTPEQAERLLAMTMSTQRVLGACCPHDGEKLQYAQANERHYCPSCTYSIDDTDLYATLMAGRRYGAASPSPDRDKPIHAWEKRAEEKKCECGVDSVGGGKHSKWCPLYTEDK